MVNFGTLTAETGWWVWRTPANLNGFRVLALILHRRSQRRSTKRCTMFGRLLGWYVIYTFFGLLSPNGILPGAKFTFTKSCSYLYWQRYCTALKQWRQPNFAAWYKEWN